MYEQAAALVLAGDLAGARALHEGIGRLLAPESSGAEVIEIGRGRRR